MGSKNGNAVVIDKQSMAFAVTALQLSSRQIDQERAEMMAKIKKLKEDPELLSGDRAETYKELFDALESVVSHVSSATVLLRDEASKRNERFNLEVDFKKVDAKAQESLDKAKAVRAKKLKGQ